MTDEQLSALEEYAGLFFTKREIAVVLACPLPWLEDRIADETTPEYAAYHRGRIIAEAKVRKSILQHATQGSSVAQEQMRKIIRENHIDEA